MKAFIAGGSGFIGKHLVWRMVQTEHELRCLARPTSDVTLFKYSVRESPAEGVMAVQQGVRP